MSATTMPIPRPRASGPSRGLILTLVVLFLAQVGFALYLSRAGGPAPGARDAKLLAFDPAAVQVIRIVQKGSDPVVLEKTDQGWQVQSLAGFPAAETKVDALLQRLAGLKRGLPVATSAEALPRLKVGDQDPEGRLTLEAGGKEVASLVLGDGAGVRRRYVRPAGETAVQEAEIGPADLPARAEDWADRAKLHLDGRDMQGIEFPGISLEKAEGGWRLADLKDGEALDPTQVEDLVRRLGNLSFTGVLGAEDRPEYGQAAPLREWRVKLASGDSLGYRLSKLASGPEPAPAKEGEAPTPKGPDWYVLKIDNRPQYLKLAGHAAEGLLSASREGLLVRPEPHPQPEPAPVQDQAAPGEATADLPGALPVGEPVLPPAQ